MDNNVALRTHIAEALRHSLKCSAAVRTDTIESHRFLHPRRLVLGEGCATFHEVMLRADEFYVSRTHLLVVRSRTLFVYSYTRALRFKLRRRIDVCYLLYKRPNARRAVRFLMYRIFLGLVEQNVYRYEAWFEAAMAYLDIDQIDDVTEYADGIGVLYRWGTCRYFDEYLSPTGRGSLAAQREQLGDGTRQVRVGRHSIKLACEGSSYVARREIGTIRQHMGVHDMLFVLTDRNFVVARFS